MVSQCGAEGLPMRGTASEVGGIVSATSCRKTVSDRSIVTPANIKNENKLCLQPPWFHCQCTASEPAESQRTQWDRNNSSAWLLSKFLHHLNVHDNTLLKELGVLETSFYSVQGLRSSSPCCSSYFLHVFSTCTMSKKASKQVSR